VTNFAFLLPEWPEVSEDATKAEAATVTDPRTSCFYARRALEAAVNWVYKADSSLQLPYQDNLSALLHEPTFKQVAGEAVFNKARLINTIGNRAVHETRPIPLAASDAAIRELFQVCYWLAHTYARGAKPTPSLTFSANLIPATTPVPAHTASKLQELETSLRERDKKLIELVGDRSALDEELVRLRAEVANAKRANEAHADNHDYSEAQTRDYFIDMLLHEAGWPLDQERDREFPVAGMPNRTGEGFVDYVLWGDDGKPLAVVEAKRTKKNAKIGQRQAELYANCLEAGFGQRPVIFYTNGYEHWLWDDISYPPRAVQGFFKRSELELMIQRRTSRKSLADAEINNTIVERYYQTRAIRRIGEAFERDLERKALLAMATGAGKTRTVIALSDLLMRCNWAKRILFLADRVALVNQAVGAFKAHLPDSSPVNLITDKTSDGRVFVSTYPSMMGLIDELKDGQRRFGVGHFDLIVIDEAHRSVYQKYRAIFQYFDSLLVGLTATPKDEVDINTYSLFDLERGVPTDAYSLEDAIKDGFLVPPFPRSVPIKFPRHGITYADLPDEEKELWDAIEWSEDGSDAPTKVESSALNSWLFNNDTVDKALAHLMTRGQMVAGGDRLGKTIIFAKNQAHAQFIIDRFDVNYPRLKGMFARGIYHSVPYAQSLIDDFSNAAKAPHIAVSVDMLDTGVDIPEVVNLVFLKPVRSKTKFWQMVGRGTRLCPDLFGPGKDKTGFDILDYCENLEFFSMDGATTEGRLVDSLGKRLFTTRLELIAELDRCRGGEPAPVSDEEALRQDAATLLHTEVASMNLDNFVVRPKRKLVEKFSEPEPWQALSPEDITALASDVAGLPSEIEPEDEEAKRFDLLMLRLQLAVLRHEPGFDRLSAQVRTIAGLLEEQASIPLIMHQLVLIEEIQSDEWWQDVTPAMLEDARKRLRLLVRLIEKQKRKIIYSDFEDELGAETEIDLLGLTPTDDFEQFRAKAQAFLRSHEDHIAIHRLRTNKPLTALDLTELEVMLASDGVGDEAAVQKATEDSQGLGLFVRSLVGLDRGAAKEAFAGFLAGKALGANQIHFVDMIINHLTEHGVMSAALLYESPFTDLSPHGPEDLFTTDEVDALVAVLDHVREAAVAAA
jgi:type I restriction enzyme R subunit